MAHYGICEVCGNEGMVETHHIVFKSKCRPLKDCPLNHIDLDWYCHRSKNGVHGRYGDKLDRQLKDKLKNDLYMAFMEKEYLTIEEIAEILKITQNNAYRLCKTLNKTEDKYYYKDIIRACVGGRYF